MKSARSVLLALVAVGLVVLVIFDLDGLSTGDRRREERHLLPSFRPERVKSIDIGNIGLRRVGLRWQLVDHVGNLDVDQAAVDALLASLQYATVERRIRQPTTPRLTLIVDDGNRHRFAIGGDDASGQSVYVTVDDSPDVAVVEKRLWTLASVPRDGWISKALTVGDATAAVELTLRYANAAVELTVGTRTLRRDGSLLDGGWADPTRAAAAWRAVEDARGEIVHGDGNPPIALYLDGKLAANIGNRCGEKGTQVRRSDGATLCFDTTELQPLLANLADDRPFPVELDDIQSATIGAGTFKVVLRHRDHRWTLDDKPADDTRTRAWLSSLLKGPSAGPYAVELTTPTRTVRGLASSLPDGSLPKTRR